MLKSLKKRSYRFVVVLLLLTTLLTFDVGRVIKVEAVATTAAIVGEVLLGLGVTYIAYQTLTGANVYVPDLNGDYEYIQNLGRTFSQTKSGSNLFKDLYYKLLVDDTYSVIDFTQDRLKEIYNDHKSIEDIQEDSSYDFTVDVNMTPVNGYEYAFNFVDVPTTYSNGVSFINEIGTAVFEFTGPRIVWYQGGSVATFIRTDLDTNYQYRNLLKSNGKYGISRSLDGVNWSGGYYGFHGGYEFSWGVQHYQLIPDSTYSYYNYYPWTNLLNVSEWDYPLFPDLPVYDSVNEEYLPLVPVDANGRQLTPQYPQNNNGNNKYPIVPYVQLPSNQKWGFNWRDALTDLLNGGSRLITYSWLADLINDFKNSLSGSGDDIDYNYFNEGDTYYITYYSTTVNDIDNPIYNIDISDQEDVIPVDLNTIEQYTNNQYLSLIKERAESFGETFGEYVAFWHNCDPEIIYAFLGASIIVLLGAFIGKWGHS